MSLRAKLRLENLESRPRIDPILPPIVVWEMDAAPERLVIGIPPVAIKESRGLSSDRLSPPASPGPEDTPLKTCRARWARCLCKGVCLVCGNCSTEPLSLVERDDKGESAGELYAGPTWTGIKPSCGRLMLLFSKMKYGRRGARHLRLLMRVRQWACAETWRYQGWPLRSRRSTYIKPQTLDLFREALAEEFLERAVERHHLRRA